MRTDLAVITVAASSAEQGARAAALADLLELPLCEPGIDPKYWTGSELLLVVSNEGLAVQFAGRGAPGAVTVDFASSALRHRRRGGHNELLGKAVGIGKRPNLRVLDATAGLGRDAFVLADLGCRVRLYERHALIHCLLADGLDRARAHADSWVSEVAGRMQLLQGDATCNEFDPRAFDVIYLDPMFPERDKSAAVKKDMALFQRLLGQAPDDGAELLRWALAQPVARVVVKRPSRAPALGDCQPSHAINGKAVRYDVHVLRGLS